MRVLNNISIKKKVMVLIMLSVTVAMAISCTAFVVNDVRLMRTEMIRQLSALAEVLGSNSTAALRFDDAETASQLLFSLNKQPLVTSAVLFDADGLPFATYPKDNLQKVSSFVEHEYDFELTSGRSEVMAKIVEKGEPLGFIRISGNMDVVHREIRHYAVIVVFVMLVSFTAAYLLASRLQGVISAPILTLARAAQQISSKGDYSIRVVKSGNDEMGTLFDEFNQMLDEVETGKKALEEAHDQLEARVTERTRQLSDINRELNKEVTERRRAEKELERAHQELVISARRAGMAEIATGVLHNVGNVLNSVNVSAEMVSNRLRSSKRSQLTRVVDLLQQHDEHLGEFLTTDEKGKQVPNFLKALADHLETEEQSMLEESQSLMKNVEHIKTIVATQQSYAGISGMLEPIDVNGLLDDAVRLNSSSFERHHIRVKRNYETLPSVLADKQRLLQIVVNLVKNAKEALLEQNQEERVLTLLTSVDEDRLIIEVSDSGVGIEKENLTRIFSHGFTTKATGHGFGLHSCANAATEMNGTLSVRSDGPMQGASFTLNLPLTVTEPV